jgi:hypothetical protein
MQTEKALLDVEPGGTPMNAKSSFPSPLKSPVTGGMENPLAVGLKDRTLLTKEGFATGFVTSKKATNEVPPPGGGLETVTETVVAVAISDAGTTAVNWELLTNVVASTLPFQCTTDPGTKLVPLTVSVNCAPPGAALAGTSGQLTKGTGLGLCAASLSAQAAIKTSAMPKAAQPIVLVVCVQSGPLIPSSCPR